MKNLVVYYSWKGNTEVVAKEISKLVDGDLIKIEEEKEFKGSAFLLAALSALLGLKSKIKPIDESVKEYDNVFIGGPVWAGRTPPAINAFLDNADFRGEKIYLFLTQSGSREKESLIKEVRKKVEKKSGKMAESFFIQTKKNKLVTEEEIKQPVAEWIKRIRIT